MNLIERLLAIGGETLLYATLGSVSSILFSFLLLWLTSGIGPFKALHEMEHHNNGAIGAAFFASSLVAAFACVLMIWTPSTDSIVGGLPWLFAGLAIGLVYYLILATVALWLLCRDNEPRGEPARLLPPRDVRGPQRRPDALPRRPDD